LNNLYFYLSKIFAPFLNFGNIVILGLILSIFLYFKFKNKLIKFTLILFSSIILLFGFLPIGSYGIKHLEKNYISQNTDFQINNIIVLGGSESTLLTKQTKKLNLNDSSERLISSVNLALKNKNSQIIYLGGSGLLNNNNQISEVDVAKRFYNEIGFDIERVRFISGSRNTIENLLKFKDLKINKPGDILITSAFHMNRSLIISKKLELDLLPYAVDFRASNSNINIISYYQSFSILKNLLNFNLFFRELIGTTITKLVL
tara:strand:- start:2864 stop:3643 length:780 start_codon:yes stop_codon:yes gene_type:complete